MSQPRRVIPSVLQDPRAVALDLSARHTLVLLPLAADDEGRLLDDPGTLNGVLWGPLWREHSPEQMDADLTALARAGYLTRYRVGDVACIQIEGWVQEQGIVRPAPSRYPSVPRPAGTEDARGGERPQEHGGERPQEQGEERPWQHGGEHPRTRGGEHPRKHSGKRPRKQGREHSREAADAASAKGRAEDAAGPERTEGHRDAANPKEWRGSRDAARDDELPGIVEPFWTAVGELAGSVSAVVGRLHDSAVQRRTADILAGLAEQVDPLLADQVRERAARWLGAEDVGSGKPEDVGGGKSEDIAGEWEPQGADGKRRQRPPWRPIASPDPASRGA